MMDDDGSGKFDPIGSLEVSLARIMGSKAQILTDELTFNG